MPWVKSFLFAFCICLLSCQVSAEESAFEADETLQKNARKWAEEFVAFAKDNYQVDLDWSQVSIKYLDDIVNDLHETYLREQPPEEQIVPVSRAIGSYVAEVYRIFYGGPWGWVTFEEGSFPGIQSKSGATFLPIAKALDRIKSGEDPDIWEYFQLLTTQ